MFEELRDMCGILSMDTMNWEGEKARRNVLQATRFYPPPPAVKYSSNRKKAEFLNKSVGDAIQPAVFSR